MSAVGYEDSGAGTGGKFRKRPFRRAQTTPYDRPTTALRPSQAAAEKNGWLSKLVDPASKLITYGAHKLFSSVFRKRLLPPPHPPKDELDANTETRDVQPHGTTAVVHSDTKEPATAGKNDANEIADASGVAELEAILKQKTFTRSEINHLTTLMLSRTVDNSVGTERVRSEPKTSDLQAFDGGQEKLSTHPAQENGIDHAVTGAISTPAIRSKVHDEDVASPAELAKAYMGSRSAKVAPTGLVLQSQMPREETPSLYRPPFNLKSPATSQRPMNDIGTSENGFVTPRFRGRSAIYSMARTPYSRMHPTTAFKASETAADTYGRLPLSIIENKQFNESQKQAVKRRSSVLENDIGSVGPIRRIRQKPNLLHPKTLTLPAFGGPRAAHGSGPLLDATELPSSSGWSSHSHSLSKPMADNNKPCTSSSYVPLQSIETAQKIFQQLDKFSPKGKSSDLKIDIAGGNTPSRMAPAVSGGVAHHGTGTVDSLKILQNVQDNKKENGRMDSVDAHFPILKTPKTVEEASVKKFVVTTDNLACQDGFEARVPASFSSHDTKIAVVSHSGFDHPQKKRAFQMSAHEDYLELDDDIHLNGVASAPSGEGAGSTELLKKSVVIPDGVPPKEAIAAEKPVVLEPKSEDSLLGKRQPDSLVDGPVATNKSIGFTFPAAPSASLSNSTSTAPITASKSAADSEKVASQDQKKLTVPAFSAKSDKPSPFAFSTSSSAVESAVQTTRLELPNSADTTAAKADGPAETDRPSTKEPVDGFTKPEGAPSPISSAKGIFNFGSTANNATPTNAFSSPITSSVTSSPGLFSSISGNPNAVPVKPFSSSTLFSGSSGLSNGFAASTSAVGAATAGTVPGTTTASSMPIFPASSSQISSLVTVTSVSSGPSFQFGSSTSATFSTPASLSAETSVPKSVETSSSQTSSGIFGAKLPETASGGTAISGFDSSNFKAANSELEPAVPSASTGPVFGFQATSAVSPVSTSAPSFLSQSTSSASASAPAPAPAFGLSGGPNFSSGASVFGSVSPAASPFSSASSSSGVTTMSSSLGSGSGTTSSIFIPSWQPSKSTFPTTFGATSPSTGFSFGAAASGSSSDGNKPSVVFGSSTSNSSSSNSAPFIFGSTTPTSSSSSSASSTSFVFGTSTTSSSASSSAISSPFVFGSSNSSSAAPVFSFSSSISTTTSSAPSPPQPVFGNNVGTPTFGFGSTSAPSGNNDQMSMEDTMAEDSMQAPTATPAPAFGQSPIAAPPSGGFVFGGAPSPSPSPSAAPGFMSAPSGNPFQFGSQPNQMPNASAFQPTGSVEFHAGSTGSFSLGSGGGDKANRRIVKVKSKMRRK